MEPTSSLLFICNPLLDITANVKVDLANKYGLKPNSTTMAQEQHLPLFDELQKDYKCQYLPGGSGQNSSRVAQWLMPGHPWYVGFVGAVGKDNEAKILKKSMDDAHVKALYYVNETLRTGKCAALIHDNCRTLAPYLAAATKYPTSHFLQIWDQVIKAEAYFITAYFFTTNPEVIDKLWSHVKDTNKIMALSLAADFWINLVPDLYLKFMPYFNFVIGNEVELDTISKLYKFTDKMPLNEEERIMAVRKLARLPTANGAPRIVVITSGAQSIFVYKHDPKVYR
jgi:adenosine kinase